MATSGKVEVGAFKRIVKAVKAYEGVSLVTGRPSPYSPSTLSRPFWSVVSADDPLFRTILVGVRRSTDINNFFRDHITVIKSGVSYVLDKLTVETAALNPANGDGWLVYVIDTAPATPTATLAFVTALLDTHIVIGHVVWNTTYNVIARWEQVLDTNPIYGLGGSGSGGAVVKITSGGPGQSYTGSVFANGPGSAATETGVSISVMNMAAGETAVYNRAVLAVKIGSTYYAQVPLWQ